MPRVELKVNGRDYAGWQSVRVTRGIKAIAGGFSLSVAEKWSNAPARPLREGYQCALAIEGQPVITGYIDKRTEDSSADSHSLTIDGRDATGDMVDSSTLLAQWEYRGVDLLTLAQRLCAQFEIPVAAQSGLELIKPAKFSIDPGDTAFEVLERACRLAGVLPISDGTGGLLLMRPGAERATTALVEGQNIKSIRAEHDSSGIYSRYVVLGQHPGTDNASGAGTSVKGEASDGNVLRGGRVLVIRPEGAVTLELAKQRAQWEATVRAARADAVTVVVQGWLQGNGALWPINARVPVKSRRVGVDGEMLISQASYSIDEAGGTVTELTLERPDAYLPEPAIAKKTASGQPWSELGG